LTYKLQKIDYKTENFILEEMNECRITSLKDSIDILKLIYNLLSKIEQSE